MIELDRKNLFFKTKIIYCSDSIYNVENYSSVLFKTTPTKFDEPTFQCREEKDYELNLDQDLEVIWSNMNRNARRNIKKAEDNKIDIKINENYEEFYKMFKDHLDVKKHIKWFNVHQLNEIKKNGTLLTAYYNNKIISGSLFLEDKENLVYWITASYRYSDDEIIKQISGNATYLIQWEIIKYAKSKGIKKYNLGEARNNKPLILFKESLGAKPITYYTYYKDYNILYEIFRRIFKKKRKNQNNDNRVKPNE